MGFDITDDFTKKPLNGTPAEAALHITVGDETRVLFVAKENREAFSKFLWNDAKSPFVNAPTVEDLQKVFGMEVVEDEKPASSGSGAKAKGTKENQFVNRLNNHNKIGRATLIAWAEKNSLPKPPKPTGRFAKEFSEAVYGRFDGEFKAAVAEISGEGTSDETSDDA